MTPLKGLHTLDEIASACGRPVSAMENLRRLGLTSGYKVAKSMGRGRGRSALYDAEVILSEVEKVDAGRAAGKSLVEMSRERGWVVKGGVSFQKDETLADLVNSHAGTLPRSIRQRLVAAADYAARLGLFECEFATLSWKIKVGKEEIVLFYVDEHAREEVSDVIRGMVETSRSGNVDAAVIYALSEWKERNENFSDHAFPTGGSDAELGLTKEESAARAREVRQSLDLQDRLDTVKSRCRKSGTAFPSHGGLQGQAGVRKP